jgi:glycine betaine/proline transport system substrate-binding protein
MQKKGLTLIVSAVFLALILAACSGGGGGGDAAITLIENPWPASELNAAVAKIIIEQEFGNPVEVVALDENASWDALAGGEADANLEVWPSGHSERIAEYIDNLGTVENGGELGPLGAIGWYVPNYVLADHPELATWEGYKDPANAALFATAETGDNGRFVAADPSWVQYDEAIISNLELPFQIVWTGSEEALLAEVSSAYSRQEPVLFYFYTPHAVFERFDLTQVELPEYSDECYADEAAIDCGYPPDQLFKAISAQLAEKDETVYQFLQNFNFGSSAPQITMLAQLDEGMSVEEAAQAWVDANESVWQAWLP